jgi:hypothetical protein
MSTEDWLSFRNKIGKFEEFLDNLIQQISDASNPQPIDDWIKNQLETYKVGCISVLFCKIIRQIPYFEYCLDFSILLP